MAVLGDIALVTQVAVFQNKKAFDQLVRKYQSPVRRFFLNQTLGDEMLSDDLAQETFIKAYVNITKFKGMSSFSTWLMRIAYNVFYDYHRGLKVKGDRLKEISSVADISPSTLHTPPSSLAYITDMKTIDEGELDYLQGIDILIVNALRQKPHHSHQTLDEAVAFAQRVGARQTWLIHSSHDIGRHEEVNASLPSDIQMAYDGQVIEI